MSHSLKKKRTRAYHSQNGLCYYCGIRMWLDDPLAFGRQFHLSAAEAAKLKCTAEHLQARSDGGSNASTNIVAACWFCNNRRHRRKTLLNVSRFSQLVRRRVRAGRWHSFPFQHLLEGN